MPPAPPKIGPYARRGWDHDRQRWTVTLTAEGQRFAADWYAGHGSGIGLLRKVHPRAYRFACAVGMDDEAVEAACAVGLIDAVRTYDPARGQFSTHLSNWVWNAVLCEASGSEYARRVQAHQEQEAGEPGRFQLSQWPAREEAEPSPAVALTARLLGRLPARQRTVLERRHNLDGRGGATLREIGVELGLSRERIRQLEAAAVRALRQHAGELLPEERA